MATASIYLRRSKASDEKSVSLDFQEREVRELLSRHGVEVTRVHVDDGKSGALMNRKAWRDWLADAPDVDYLAAWAIDRTTRSGLMGAAAIIEAIGKTGTRFLTSDGLDSESPEFDLILGIRASLAKSEWMRASARSKATRRQLIEQGKHPSGVAPFGCQIDAEGRLQIKADEADILREAASMVVSGHGMRAALRWLNETMECPTRRGATWTRSSLTGTFESDASARLIFGRSERDALIAALHPKPGTRRSGGRPAKFLLTAAATCAGCGARVTTGRDLSRNVTRYACPTTTNGRPCRAPSTIRADRVDEHIESEFLRIFGDHPFIEERIVIDAGDLDTAQDAFDAAQAALLASPGAETLVAYQEAQEALQKALDRPSVRQKIIRADRTYRQVWDEADQTERRNVLWSVAHSITITKSATRGGKLDLGRVDVTWGKDVETAPSWEEVTGRPVTSQDLLDAVE